MKKIQLQTLSERNDYSIDNFIKEVLDMEFIKYGDKYLIKDSNGLVVSEEEKLQLEKEELILEDITSNKCQGNTTRKIRKINKKIEALNDPIKETEPTEK